VTIIKELKMLNKRKKTKAAKIRSFIAANPNATARYIADQLGFPIQSVYNVKHKLRAAENKIVTLVGSSNKSLMEQLAPDIPVYEDSVTNVTSTKLRGMIEMIEKPSDPVNNPAHYTEGGIETIDYIEAKGLGYHLGNAIKYISRAGKKGTNQGLEDLRKAQWYLARAIEKNEYASPSR
jgi:hypothetical protein